jgi:hypothetical protein
LHSDVSHSTFFIATPLIDIGVIDKRRNGRRPLESIHSSLNLGHFPKQASSKISEEGKQYTF